MSQIASAAKTPMADKLIGTYIWDVAADCVYSDAGVSKCFGLDPVVGAKGTPIEMYLGAIEEADRAAVRDAIFASMVGPPHFEAKYRIRKSPDCTVTVLALGECLRDPQTNKPTMFFGQLIDLSTAPNDPTFEKVLYQQIASVRAAAAARGHGLVAHLMDMAMEDLFPTYGEPLRRPTSQ